MRSKKWVRRWLGAAAAVALAGAACTLAPGSASADESGPVTISGKVGCLNSYAPDGIWVESANGGSGFADFEVRPDEGLEGFGYGYYTFVLPHGGSYHLNVGCDGSPQQWGLTAVTPQVSGSDQSFDCNDIKPALKTAGEWAFSRVLGQWVKAFDLTHGIAYKSCATI